MLVHGFDYDGSHPESEGVDAGGNHVPAPLHRHEVSQDWTHLEIGVQYALRSNLDLWFRVPFDYRDQDSRVGSIDPSATPTDIQNILRNMNIHHRDETYSGISDLMLLAAWRRQSLWRTGDSIVIAGGFTIPVGETEDDPIVAGDNGQEHLHIQFGSGTVDPLLEIYYGMPVNPKLIMNAGLAARVPLYESSKDFLGPNEFTANLSLTWLAKPRLRGRGGLTFIVQDHSEWNGVTDPNSGLIGLSGILGVSVDLPGHSTFTMDVRVPIKQETLDDDSDTFEQGPSLIAGVSRRF